LPELDRRGKEINERRRRLWSQIAATPARTVEGMHAKIAFASKFYFGEREDLKTSSYRPLWITRIFTARRRAHPLRAASLRAAKLDCKRAPERALLKVAGAA
jgi:hypothetical protein